MTQCGIENERAGAGESVYKDPSIMVWYHVLLTPFPPFGHLSPTGKATLEVILGSPSGRGRRCLARAQRAVPFGRLRAGSAGERATAPWVGIGIGIAIGKANRQGQRLRVGTKLQLKF